MRELETSLQQFGEFILKARLVKEHAAPYCVRWVRRFLARPAADEPLADQVRRFCEELEQNGDCQLPPANGLASAATQYRRGRARPHGTTAGPRTDALAHQNPPLLLSHRSQLRRLGAALPRVRGRAASRAASNGRVGIGSRLPDPPGRTTARVGQHAESGPLRHPVPMPGSPRGERGKFVGYGESQTWKPSAGRPESPGNRSLTGGHARDDMADGRADLRRRVAGVGMLRAAPYTPFATASRRTCCSTVWISGRSRSTWGTPTSRRRWCTPTSSKNSATRREVLSISFAPDRPGPERRNLRDRPRGQSNGVAPTR